MGRSGSTVSGHSRVLPWSGVEQLLMHSGARWQGEGGALGILGVSLLNHCPSDPGPKNDFASLPQGTPSTQLPKMGINQDKDRRRADPWAQPSVLCWKSRCEGKPALDAKIDPLPLDYSASKGHLRYLLWSLASLFSRGGWSWDAAEPGQHSLGFFVVSFLFLCFSASSGYLPSSGVMLSSASPVSPALPPVPIGFWSSGHLIRLLIMLLLHTGPALLCPADTLGSQR